MGIRGSGLTHMRYGHATRPTELALVCPRCAAEMRATQPSSATRVSAGDCTAAWSEPWALACTACTCRKRGATWDELRATSALFYRAEVAGVTLWAWNRAHLTMLLGVLEGHAPAGPLLYFSTYMRRQWLVKTRRAAFARAARRMLAGARAR